VKPAHQSEQYKKVPPPTSEGHEGRLFPPEHSIFRIICGRLQQKSQENWLQPPQSAEKAPCDQAIFPAGPMEVPVESIHFHHRMNLA